MFFHQKPSRVFCLPPSILKTDVAILFHPLEGSLLIPEMFFLKLLQPRWFGKWFVGLLWPTCLLRNRIPSWVFLKAWCFISGWKDVDPMKQRLITCRDDWNIFSTWHLCLSSFSILDPFKTTAFPIKIRVISIWMSIYVHSLYSYSETCILLTRWQGVYLKTPGMFLSLKRS